jgi:hypothetical protein
MNSTDSIGTLDNNVASIKEDIYTKIVVNDDARPTFKYKNYMLSSHQAAGISQVLISKCQDIVNNSSYFKNNNLTSQRVLNDCIAYINFFFAKKEIGGG